MEPFDLDAASALRAEATGEGPQFTFHDVSFTMLPLAEMDWELLELLDSNMREGLTQLLGAQSEKFWELKPTVVEVMTLREEMLARYGGGIAAGESVASSASSNRTVRRSRQRSPKPSQASAAEASA